MINTSIRVLKFAIQNFFRNIWLSIATLTVLIITLLLVNIIITINQIKVATLAGVQSRVDISLDFKQTVPEAEILQTRRDFQTDSRIDAVLVITPDDNLEKFRVRYPEIGEKVIPVLDKNPLGYTLIVRAFNLSDYTEILNEIESDLELMDKLESTRFNDYRSLTTKASELSEKINVGAYTLAGIFFIIALIIVFNTIRVSIYTHQEEIEIMKLVGATNSFIRMPFLIESFLYSIISVVVVLGIMFFSLQFVQPLLSRFFADFTTVDLLQYYSTHMLYVFGLQLLAVLIVNCISSLIALGRYLR